MGETPVERGRFPDVLLQRAGIEECGPDNGLRDPQACDDQEQHRIEHEEAPQVLLGIHQGIA